MNLAIRIVLIVAIGCSTCSAFAQEGKGRPHEQARVDAAKREEVVRTEQRRAQEKAVSDGVREQQRAQQKAAADKAAADMQRAKQQADAAAEVQRVQAAQRSKPAETIRLDTTNEARSPTVPAPFRGNKP